LVQDAWHIPGQRDADRWTVSITIASCDRSDLDRGISKWARQCRQSRWTTQMTLDSLIVLYRDCAVKINGGWFIAKRPGWLQCPFHRADIWPQQQPSVQSCPRANQRRPVYSQQRRPITFPLSASPLHPASNAKTIYHAVDSIRPAEYCKTLNVCVPFISRTSRAKQNREVKGCEYQLQAKK